MKNNYIEMDNIHDIKWENLLGHLSCMKAEMRNILSVLRMSTGFLNKLKKIRLNDFWSRVTGAVQYSDISEQCILIF